MWRDMIYRRQMSSWQLGGRGCIWFYGETNWNRFSREVVCKDNVLNLNLDISWQLTISLLEILNLVSKVQRLPLASSSHLVFLAHSHQLFSHQAIPITGQCGITDGNFAAGLRWGNGWPLPLVEQRYCLQSVRPLDPIPAAIGSVAGGCIQPQLKESSECLET